MRHAARPAVIAFVLLSGLAGALVPASCAHTNSPGGFLQCMENAKDEAAAQQLIYAMIDKDATAALEAALVAVPDAVKCLLQRAASVVGAGPQESERARKAKAFLDSHGLSAAGSSRSGSLAFRMALPFEDYTATVLIHPVQVLGGGTTFQQACGGRTRDVAATPWMLGTVCVTDDYTFNFDNYRDLVARQLASVLGRSKPGRSPLWHTATRRPSGFGPGSGGGTWGG